MEAIAMLESAERNEVYYEEIYSVFMYRHYDNESGGLRKR